MFDSDSQSDRQYELRLTAEPRRFAVVRRIVAAHLRHWHLPDLVDPTALGVTELLANVYRHVGPDAPCVLRLSCVGGSLRCEVRDGDATLPRLLTAGDDAPGGRGLGLVAACSKEWGARREEAGKVVWFALEAIPQLTEPAPTRRPAPAHGTWPTPSSARPAPPVLHRDEERARVPARARA